MRIETDNLEKKANMNALEKYAAKRKLTTKLSGALSKLAFDPGNILQPANFQRSVTGVAKRTWKAAGDGAKRLTQATGRAINKNFPAASGAARLGTKLLKTPVKPKSYPWMRR